MITLTVLLIIIGLVIGVVLSGSLILLDPIIAILILIGFIKLIRKIFRRKKK